MLVSSHICNSQLTAKLKLKFSCDRRSVGHSVLVSGTHLGSMTIFFITVGHVLVSCCGAPSLTKGWVCNLLVQLLLGLASTATVGSKFHTTRDHILLSHLRILLLWGPGPRIYILQEHGGPVVRPGHWVPFLSPLTTCRPTVEVL
jgi:hypothetical protein